MGAGFYRPDLLALAKVKSFVEESRASGYKKGEAL